MALTKGQEHLGSRIFKFATLGVTEELIWNKSDPVGSERPQINPFFLFFRFQPMTKEYRLIYKTSVSYKFCPDYIHFSYHSN